MKERRGIWIALVVAFAIASWWLALAGPDRDDDALATDLSEPPPPAAEPPPRPAPAPAPVPAIPEPEAPEPAPAPPAPQTAVAKRVPEPTDSIIPIPPDTRGFVDALEGRFNEDPRDSGATEVETWLRKLFQGPRMPAGMLKSVLCRQTVCKLEIQWIPPYDPVYRHVMAQLIGDNAKFLATRAGPPDDRGAIQVEAFWIRAAAKAQDDDPTGP